MTIKFFDNIGSSFTEDSNTNFIAGSAISGFNAFSSTQVGSRINYLARNVGDGFIEFEEGIGDVVNNTGGITVERDVIIASSNSNNKVEFSTAGTKSIFIDVNETSYKKAFNNLLEKSSNFTADDYSTTYIVNVLSNSVTATLPSATGSNKGLIIAFKLDNADSTTNTLPIAATGSQTLDGSTNNDVYTTNTFTQYISTGTGWQSLQQDLNVETGIPRGETYAFQYNAGGGNFGANTISTSADGDLNIGSATTFRVNGKNEINKNYSANDTVIYGSAVNKNLYVSQNGNVGINIPSGYVPQASLQIIQGTGAESIRLENRQNDNSSVFTLFHRPSINPSSGDVNAVINLAGKDSISSQSNYSVLKSTILNSTNGSTTGGFDVDVQVNGVQKNILSASNNKLNLGLDNTLSNNTTAVGSSNTVSGSGTAVFGKGHTSSATDSVVLAKDNNSIYINDNVEIKHNSTTKLSVTSSSVNVTGPIKADTIGYASDVADGSLIYASGNNLLASSASVNNLITGRDGGLVVKTADNQSAGSDNIYTNVSGMVVNSGVVLPQLNNSSPLYANNNTLSEYTDVVFNTSSVDVNTNINFNNGITIDPDTTASNYAVLTHTGNGVATWQNLNLVDVVIDNGDIKWNKNTSKSATISDTRLQLTLNDNYSNTDFSINDNIAIVDGSNVYYNTIKAINSVNSVTIFDLQDSVTGTSTAVNIYSTNKGGYLELGLANSSTDYSSTKNVLSNRSGVDTVFNSKKYNINYDIKGASTNSAIYVKATSLAETDHSPVIINGNAAQTLSDSTEATLTVNGSIYAEKLQSANPYIDGGTIEFNG